MQLSFLEPVSDRAGPWATVHFGPAQNDESVAKRPDQVAVRRSDVRILGETDPVPVRADALLRAAAVTAADVLIVPPADGDDAEDVPAGGLGALLRWTYEPTAV
ncbi:hypothetical protein [Streptomyces sp. NPDC007905]|uniref:hypothetical protein n=1 Tax=Streptomyces sp. NPDC007905 TaxID=3364788 RepID=UPI0036E44163